MEELTQYIKTYSDFVQQAHWFLPAAGLLFIFLCIVSKGFRNFILGLIILGILIFEGFWFYGHFYSSEEDRADLRRRVEVVFESKKSEKAPTPTSPPTPAPEPTSTLSPTPRPRLQPTPTPPPTPPRPMLPPTPTPIRYPLKDRRF